MSTTRHTDTIEVITRDQRRRRWSLAEKSALVKRTYEAGMSVSLVARQEGVAASLLFQWRKLERQGAQTAVSAGEAVVPASELAAARGEIAKLQRVLGKKTLQNEVLKEAVEYAAKKKGLRARPRCPGTANEAGVPGARAGALQRHCSEQQALVPRVPSQLIDSPTRYRRRPPQRRGESPCPAREAPASDTVIDAGDTVIGSRHGSSDTVNLAPERRRSPCRGARSGPHCSRS